MSWKRKELKILNWYVAIRYLEISTSQFIGTISAFYSLEYSLNNSCFSCYIISGTISDIGQDLAKLAPKKPNWDLKRDLERKLEKLERKTQIAIGDLIRTF